MAGTSDPVSALIDAVAMLGAAIEQLKAENKAIKTDMENLHRWGRTVQSNLDALNGRQRPGQDTALNRGSPGA